MPPSSRLKCVEDEFSFVCLFVCFEKEWKKGGWLEY
jgi:hypothetical protein